jgi:hypothetical protein
MKKAIVVTCDRSKINSLVGNAEVFSGDKDGDCIVVVEGAVFDDTISKLNECFGAANVRPYSCKIGDEKKVGIIHNFAGVSAAGKGKKEKHFFV